MIGLELNEENFEYDIYSLIKAFYPDEEIRREYDKAERVVTVQYSPEQITITWKENRLCEPFEKGASQKDGEMRKEILEKSRSISIKGAERPEVKSRLKRILYEILSDQSKRQLPWGTLTGIRPTKIPFAMLENKKSKQEIRDYMKSVYLASEKKIDLSIEIAEREREILQHIDYQNGYSLYVGIPFCPTRCLYCSFTSYPLDIWKKRVDEYLDALCQEIVFVSQAMESKKLNTLYVGGGTPTTLEPKQLERLMKALTSSFDFSYNQEFTVEAGRPDSVTEEKLEVMKKYGVSRISVNPQTMKQQTLDLIGRKHSIEQTKEAFDLARRCGFENINMDLISGLPGETKEDMEHTMQMLSQWKPDSITIHSLAIKRASRLNEFREQYKKYISMNNESIADMQEHYAREMGLLPYYLYRQKNMAGNLENVGYSAPGKAGIYNILIMEEKQTILALGAGATTKMVSGERIERVDNVKSVEQYIDRIDEMIERKRRGLLEMLRR